MGTMDKSINSRCCFPKIADVSHNGCRYCDQRRNTRTRFALKRVCQNRCEKTMKAIKKQQKAAKNYHWKDETIFFLDNAKNLAVVVSEKKVVSFQCAVPTGTTGKDFVKRLDVENNMVELDIAGKSELVELQDATEFNKLVLLRRPNGKARSELFPSLLLPNYPTHKFLTKQKCSSAQSTWNFLGNYVEQPERYRVRRGSSRICFDEIHEVRKSLLTSVNPSKRTSFAIRKYPRQRRSFA